MQARTSAQGEAPPGRDDGTTPDGKAGGTLTSTNVSGGRNVRFEAGAPGIRVARSWVADVARQAGASTDAERVAALLTTEAVTNAVVHGPPGGRVDVEARVTDRRLHIEVSDESTTAPVLRKPTRTELSGRGVMLIDRLSTAWGVQLHSDAKTVWFDVAI